MPKVKKKEFIMTVFDDGSVEIKEILKENINQLLEECSIKMKQILLVILRIMSLRDEKIKEGSLVDYQSIYNDAIIYIAESLDVSANSVRDKLERQLSMTAAGIRSLIEDYIENGSHKLERLLLKSVSSTQKERQDNRVIEAFFK